MKKIILSALSAVFLLTACAQKQEVKKDDSPRIGSELVREFKLPDPQKTGGKPLMEAINERQTMRSFSDQDLTTQQLADLLWVAYGFNREERRTVPTSRNKQEMEIFVALKSGIYLWDSNTNVLSLVTEGDFRKETGAQSFVGTAAAELIFVCDKTKADAPNEQKLTEATYANAGFISQNVYLYCASEGLATVVRGMVPKEEELSKIMKLRSDQMIVLGQTVGYPK